MYVIVTRKPGERRWAYVAEEGKGRTCHKAKKFPSESGAIHRKTELQQSDPTSFFQIIRLAGKRGRLSNL